MAASAHPLADPPQLRDPLESTVAVGIAAFAAVQLGLALFMAVSAHGFYKAVGPFGAFNGHYIHDVSTFYAALGVGLLVAALRRDWRVPVLAIATIQYALHSVNHLVDIGKADPAWNGYFDFFSLAAATGLLAWMWLRSARSARAPGRPADDARATSRPGVSA
jgi:hypothetical protein